MKKLYAPWRNAYLKEAAKHRSLNETKDECVFCTQFNANDDEKYLILSRSTHAGLILNYYPYNAGHLMAIPFDHKADLNELSAAQRSDLFELVNSGIELLKRVIKPDGFNVGINLGAASGGGIPSHLHIHLLPRWEGDTNFLPILGDTKVISTDLTKLYKELKTGL